MREEAPNIFIRSGMQSVGRIGRDVSMPLHAVCQHSMLTEQLSTIQAEEGL